VTLTAGKPAWHKLRRDDVRKADFLFILLEATIQTLHGCLNHIVFEPVEKRGLTHLAVRTGRLARALDAPFQRPSVIYAEVLESNLEHIGCILSPAINAAAVHRLHKFVPIRKKVQRRHSEVFDGIYQGIQRLGGKVI